jgi:hypothetical protein
MDQNAQTRLIGFVAMLGVFIACFTVLGVLLILILVGFGTVF